MANAQSRLSYEAFLVAVGRPSQRTLAAWTGVHVRMFQRWSKPVEAGGGIPANSADKVASILGYHPVEIWGMQWIDTFKGADEDDELDDVAGAA